MLIGERLLLTIWVGGLWTIGYMVAPALFANLEDRALAGSLAGTLFEIIAYTGLACGTLLLLFNQLRYAGKRLNWRAVVLLVMILLVITGQFIIAPMMGELRSQDLTDTTEFARLHGAASALYLVNSILGMALVLAPENRG